MSKKTRPKKKKNQVKQTSHLHVSTQLVTSNTDTVTQLSQCQNWKSWLHAQIKPDSSFFSTSAAMKHCQFVRILSLVKCKAQSMLSAQVTTYATPPPHPSLWLFRVWHCYRPLKLFWSRCGHVSKPSCSSVQKYIQYSDLVKVRNKNTHLNQRPMKPVLPSHFLLLSLPGSVLSSTLTRVSTSSC